ncbi:hypothetical protein [Elioraea sp.]|uniref:hypothetical protein n=1 Tax=Elioraea sp. TaxID=2185103 RepID=UPI00261702D1|nr:hypothetical protein [Elioraea sp.]
MPDASPPPAIVGSSADRPTPALAPVQPPPLPHPHVARPASPQPAGEPTLAIGQIEIVMAPPPRPSPAPAPPPDRGFARYAAMRSARDRARW